MDTDFYKRMYADSWAQSSEKEIRVAKMIAEGTLKTVNACGFGAGSDAFISGSAESHGFEKNEPDLAIVGTNIFLEVTGPLTPHVEADAPLWIRPGKIDYAEQKRPEKDIWLVHHIVKADLFRVIHFNEAFYTALDDDEFSVIRPFIRGSKMTFIEIEPDHSTVQPWDRLTSYINNRFPKMETW